MNMAYRPRTMVNGALSTIRSVIASFVLIGAQWYKAGLAKAGIDIDALAARLQDEGGCIFRQILDRSDSLHQFQERYDSVSPVDQMGDGVLVSAGT